MGQYQVKESKEAILALVILGKFVADRLKDGVDLDDAKALFEKLKDEEFKAKLSAGVEGIDKVPAELKEIDLADIIDLAKILPDILALFKKEEVASV